ncbi:MAG: hypothetical protein NZ603_06790 [Acidimicrobiales bacterium]|nr:hypothetical protein [Acidimicrobiales bacterium]
MSLAQHPEAHVQQLDAGWMADNAASSPTAAKPPPVGPGNKLLANG